MNEVTKYFGYSESRIRNAALRIIEKYKENVAEDLKKLSLEYCDGFHQYQQSLLNKCNIDINLLRKSGERIEYPYLLDGTNYKTRSSELNYFIVPKEKQISLLSDKSQIKYFSIVEETQRFKSMGGKLEALISQISKEYKSFKDVVNQFPEFKFAIQDNWYKAPLHKNIKPRSSFKFDNLDPDIFLTICSEYKIMTGENLV